MYVTSDVYSLSKIAEQGYHKPLRWKENLVAGVAVFGSSWPGGNDALDFLVEAAEITGITSHLTQGGYNVESEDRTRNTKPGSLQKTLALRLKQSPDSVTGVLLAGEKAAAGAERGVVHLGGELVGRQLLDGNGNRPYAGHFLFPFDISAFDMAKEILALSVEFIRSDYGYLFIRDEFCFPMGYDSGFSPPFPMDSISDEEGRETRAWALAKYDWDSVRAQTAIRDVYNVNLIGRDILCKRVNPNVTLQDWICGNGDHGKLIHIKDGRSIWLLNDKQIELVRPTLQTGGISMSRIRHIYRADMFHGAS